MNHTICTLLFCLIFSSSIFGQNENNYWFFGNGAGLDFSTGTAVAVGSNLNTKEGCATISDAEGRLLFYTDGSTVYDKNQNIMPNGTGLLGNSTSTSSAIILPKPCSDTEYYIFTVDFGNGTSGINFSLVNLDDNGDCFHDPVAELGDVDPAMKNVNLPGPTGERICALKQSNGLDYWVIATEKNTNNFYVYELTEIGVNQTPLIQSLGPVLSAGYYMKASPDRSKLALADGATRSVYLYDFDDATGQISSHVLVGTVTERAYGVEFSPNSQKLYYSDFAKQDGTGNGEIYEVDIVPSLGTPSLIGTIPNDFNRYACGALQLSPENPQRILIAKDGESMLAAISNPDQGCVLPSGDPANFDPNAIPLGGICHLGLPTFISGEIKQCKTLDMLAYQPAAPSLFSTAIETEMMTDGFLSLDKEYEDIDNDGDIDILFTKSNVLHVLYNSGGYCNAPTYALPSVSLGISDCYSYRLFDWNGDGANDLIIHGTIASTDGIFLFLNNGTGGFPASPSNTLLQGGTDYAFDNNQLIEVGDLNGDNAPDILISGQGAIWGTHYFENDGTGNFPFDALMIPENSGSYPCPELYDADCQNGLDLLLSDPLYGPPSDPVYGGGRLYVHANLGGPPTSNALPNLDLTGQINQFGFLDIPETVNEELRCDWVITRIVDFFNDGCPIAIAYSPCEGKFFFYYQQGCVCSNQNFATSIEDTFVEEIAEQVKLYPNPSKGQLTIQTPKEVQIREWKIYSLEGKLLRAEVYQGQNLDLTGFSLGVYLVVLQTEKGRLTRKVMLQ